MNICWYNTILTKPIGRYDDDWIIQQEWYGSKTKLNKEIPLTINIGIYFWSLLFNIFKFVYLFNNRWCNFIDHYDCNAHLNIWGVDLNQIWFRFQKESSITFYSILTNRIWWGALLKPFTWRVSISFSFSQIK